MKSSSPWKNGIITGFAFFLTVTILSIGYAALSSGLSLSDKVGTGSGLSSSSWNKIVDSILELDGRTTSIASSGAQVKIAGGSPGAGKVLTSDASGVASWKDGISHTTIDAVIPINQVLSGSCDATGATLTIITPGIYGIQVRADAYLYDGNFNNINI